MRELATEKKTVPSKSDPIIDALKQRSKDLSRSITNPKTLATKLRESLVDLAGKDAIVYHIGVEYNATTQTAKVEISRLTPHFVAKLDSTLTTASIGLAYTNQTASGWKIAVGLEVSDNFKKPHGSGVVASFGVTISK